MERPNAWTTYTDEQLSELNELNRNYMNFISDNKTEREACAASIALAREAGYIDLADAIAAKTPLAPGAKLYSSNRGKALMLVQLGMQPLQEGVNILGAHIDSPRLDIKQNPLDEKNEIVSLDTHYYGGVKKYQWVTLPLAIHGVVARKDGSIVNVSLGEKDDDPVFVISDLLPHLAQEQMQKKATEVIEGEMLDVIFGNRPLKIDNNSASASLTAGTTAKAHGATASCASEETCTDNNYSVKHAVMQIVTRELGIDEEDFLSAELEVVPAGRARDLGIDRSMILGYGQDDRSCAYTSLIAQLRCPVPHRTAVTLLVDKEEIGSVGATGMHSRFFEDTLAEILELAGEGSDLALRRCLRNSRMLSSDVSAAYDPSYNSVFEAKNASYLGHGLTFNKYTGARGKSGSNDADAEYVALIRRCMDSAGVHFQTAELGRVDAGGGGTIAYILANYGMDVIDCGVPVLSMHSPWEATSKADIYEAYRGYRAFLDLA